MFQSSFGLTQRFVLHPQECECMQIRLLTLLDDVLVLSLRLERDRHLGDHCGPRGECRLSAQTSQEDPQELGTRQR